MTVCTVELSAGEIQYEDSGGDGPVVVLLHGLLMDSSLWHGVVAALPEGIRCIVPTLPLGAHPKGMRSDAELSVPSITGLVVEILEHLDLNDVTLVGNDTGGAIAQLLVGEDKGRVGKLVLVSCEAFGNFPPGLTGKTIVLLGKLPALGFGIFMQQLRLKPVRRLPIVFGWLTKRGDKTTKAWAKPIQRRADVRRDAVRLLRSIGRDRDLMYRAAENLPMFHGPTLIVWAERDRVMPPEHGRRLAEIIPQARFVELPDTYALIPLDQPTRLGELISEFVLS